MTKTNSWQPFFTKSYSRPALLSIQVLSVSWCFVLNVMHCNYQPLHFKFRILVPHLVNFPAFFSFHSFASLSLFFVLFRSFLPLISLFLPLWSFPQVQRVQQSSLHNCKASNSEKIALTWASVGGKRRSGRRRETWRRTVNEEREHLGFKTWRQAEVAAREKVVWRRRINGAILHGERIDRWWNREKNPPWRTFVTFAPVKGSQSLLFWPRTNYL